MNTPLESTTMTNFTRRNRTILSVLCGVSLSFTGCAFAPQSSWPTEWFTGKPKIEIPDRAMVIWTDTVLHQPQQPGVRGFGGRVYFYKGKDTEPIEVDGGLAIYVFDAADNPSLSHKPERKFVFTADQFAEHMSHTDMGPSYSIWVPWDQVGGPPRTLSIVTRFEGRNGGVVISDPTIKLLPGVKRLTSSASDATSVDPLSTHSGAVTRAAHQQPTNDPDSHIRQAGFSNTATEVTPAATSRHVETIDLPPSFARRLQATHIEPSPPKSATSHASLLLTPPAAENSPAASPEVPASSADRPQVPAAAQGSYAPTVPSKHQFRTAPTETRPRAAHWIEELPTTPR